MADTRLRKLARAAAAGDLDAMELLRHARRRAGERPAVQAGGILRGDADARRARRQALRVDWRTPAKILECVRAFCGGPIPLDAATSPSNPTRALRILTPKDCGLAAGWAERLQDLPPDQRIVWINPPYGRGAPDWYRKITREALEGWRWELRILALLPANRFETGYMQDLLRAATTECLPRGRLAFERPTGEALAGNPFASILYGLNTELRRFARAFDRLGLVRRVEAA